MDFNLESEKLVRRPTAHARVTWSGRSISNAVIAVTTKNRGSLHNQVIKSIGKQQRWAHCNSQTHTLGSRIHPAPSSEHGEGYLVGWWGSNKIDVDGTNALSDENGNFPTNRVWINVTFSEQNIESTTIKGYLSDSDPLREYPVNFSVYVRRGTDQIPSGTMHVVNNDKVEWTHNWEDILTNADNILLIVNKWSHPFSCVKITGIMDDYSVMYDGNDILNLNILEETDASSGTIPLSQISVNDMDISLQNYDKQFSMQNPLSSMLKPKRRIVPYIGFKDDEGVEHLLPRGLYFTEKWNATEENASTSAKDRLGLLQDINYNGIGHIDDPDNDATTSYWQGQTMHTVLTDILTDLKNNYMHDLVWELDNTLYNYVVPITFFDNKSYFEVLKDIATITFSNVYMDVPTEAERIREQAEHDLECNDVLRIKPIKRGTIFGDPKPYNDDNIISRSYDNAAGEIANIVRVKWQEYEIIDGKPEPKEYFTGIASSFPQQSSVLDFGKIYMDIDNNKLIQTFGFALDLANKIANTFSKHSRKLNMETFGNITHKLGDILTVTEYEINGQKAFGNYVIDSINTNYDGGLRQNISTIFVGEMGFENVIEQTHGQNKIEIEENGKQSINIKEGGS